MPNTVSSSPMVQNVSVGTPVMTARPLPSPSSLVPEACMKEALSCELSPLGFHLNNAIKDKIWRGDYIDILSLLPSAKKNRLEKKNGDKFEDRCRSVPRSFNNWL